MPSEAAAPLMSMSVSVSRIQERLALRQKVLMTLLNAHPHRYASLYMARHRLAEELRGCSGLYHFYELDGDQRTSLYLGKGLLEIAEKPGPSKWGLYHRINQHFHPSQTSTLPGRLGKLLGITTKRAMEERLCRRPVFLQVLAIGRREEDGRFLNLLEQEREDGESLNRFVELCAHYAISLLEPRHGE